MRGCMRKSPEPKQNHTVKEIAEFLKSPYKGDGNKIITDVADIGEAGGNDIVFASGKKHLESLKKSQAGAAIIPPGEEPFEFPVIICDNPHLAFAKTISLFYPYSYPDPGIDAHAFVSPSANMGKNVSVGAFSYRGCRDRR
jgi:UDP-3-O-[3-hydroxymyristoyl] glucosamine N-acyltransferase